MFGVVVRTYKLDAVAGVSEVLEGVESVGGDFVLHAAVAEAAFGSLVAEVLDGGFICGVCFAVFTGFVMRVVCSVAW